MRRAPSGGSFLGSRPGASWVSTSAIIGDLLRDAVLHVHGPQHLGHVDRHEEDGSGRGPRRRHALRFWSHFPMPMRTSKSFGCPPTRMVKALSAVMMSRSIPAFVACTMLPEGFCRLGLVTLRLQLLLDLLRQFGRGSCSCLGILSLL